MVPVFTVFAAVVAVILYGVSACRRLSKLERALKQSEDRAKRAEHLASIGMLVAEVGHEIKNPLATVMLSLEMLAAEIEDPMLAGLVERARSGGVCVLRIVRDLNMYSGTSDGGKVPVDLRKVLDTSISLAASQIQEHVRIIRDYGNVPPVAGDEGRLAQVFLNLILNAAQALPAAELARSEIRIVTRLGGNGLVVAEVCDSGVGIAPADLPHLFEPFFTTKSYGMGTGLGLAISRKIINALGGKIAVSSQVGCGSVFSVTLSAIQ